MRPKPPKEIRERREEQRQMRHKRRQQEKTIIGMHPWAFVLTVLGLLLTAGGLILGLLMLVSRPTVSLDPPTDANDILSTQIVISNEGVLPLEDVDVGVFIRSINSRLGPVLADILGSRYQPPSKEILPGQKKTVRITPFRLTSAPIVSADIGLVVCYKPIIIPKWAWWGDPKVFRFDAVQQADGTARLRQQPADNSILADYSAKLAEHGGTTCSGPP
jgi:hypothetical protein